MHGLRFYKNENKHEVAIHENKHAGGRPKGKGNMIATEGMSLTSAGKPHSLNLGAKGKLRSSNLFRSFARLRSLRVLENGNCVAT